MIRQAGPGDLDAVRALLREYAKALAGTVAIVPEADGATVRMTKRLDR